MSQTFLLPLCRILDTSLIPVPNFMIIIAIKTKVMNWGGGGGGGGGIMLSKQPMSNRVKTWSHMALTIFKAWFPYGLYGSLSVTDFAQSVFKNR